MSTQTNRTLTAALTLALAVGLTACGSGDDAEGGAGVQATTPGATTTDGTTPGTDDDTSDGGTSGEDGMSADDTATGATGGADGPTGDLTAVALAAITTAEGEAGGTAYELDDDTSADDRSWEVDVAVGDRSVQVTVSADGVTVVETEDEDLDGDDRAALETATVTLADAVETAVAQVGGTLDDAELEEEDGTWFWKVTVDGTDSGDEDTEVLVDVSSGDVVPAGG